MRERVGHGEVGRGGLGHGGGGGAGRRLGAWFSGEQRPGASPADAPWADEGPVDGWAPGEGSSVEAWRAAPADDPAAEDVVPAEPMRGRAVVRAGGAAPADPARPRGWRVARRRGPGPRPVRPGGVAGAVRPPEVPRPVGPATRPPVPWWGPAAPRVLARRGGACAVRRRGRARVRQLAAGVALVAASAFAVVALGLLAGAAAPAPSGSAVEVVRPAAPVVVTVEPGETVWEVADRVAPGLSGAQRAALAERIAADNGLGSARPEPGRVLRVVAG